MELLHVTANILPSQWCKQIIDRLPSSYTKTNPGKLGPGMISFDD